MPSPASRRYGLARGILTGVVVLVLIAFGIVQSASDALTVAVAEPGSFPTHFSLAYGLRVYRAMDRITGAPFAASTLARYELARHAIGAAERYALTLPATPERNELLARVALARGEHRLAYEYFFAAPDIEAVQREVRELAATDPQRAYVDERNFKNHLIVLTIHPDAVAQAYWMLGAISTSEADQAPSAVARVALLRRGLTTYRRALALAPLNMTYILAAANQALALNDLATAHALFAHGMNVNPASADALAGLGIIAVRMGERGRAQAYAARARALNPRASELLALERLLP